MPLGFTVTVVAKLVDLNVFRGGSESAISKADRLPSSKYIQKKWLCIYHGVILGFESETNILDLLCSISIWNHTIKQNEERCRYNHLDPRGKQSTGIWVFFRLGWVWVFLMLLPWTTQCGQRYFFSVSEGKMLSWYLRKKNTYQKSKPSSILFMSINSLDLTSEELWKSESRVRSTAYMCANLPPIAQSSSGSQHILRSWFSSLSLICCLPNLLAIKLAVKQEWKKLSAFNSLFVILIPLDFQILYEKCIHSLFYLLIHMQVEEAALFLLCSCGVGYFFKENFQKMVEVKNDA